MGDYFLVDVTHNKANKKKFRSCAVLAQISLLHGTRNITDRLLSEYWTFEEPHPNIDYFRKEISKANIRWYLYNFMEVSDPIWNADFIRGVTQAGLVKKFPYSFPTFTFFQNSSIENIFNNCPFYGEKNKNWKIGKNIENRYKWSNSPILCLKYSEKSISFMAGVFSVGRIYVEDGISYVRYNKKIEFWLKKWNIPIEKTDVRSVYISPFWPSLFSFWMPDCCEQWGKIKKPYQGEEYSLIMWKVFSGMEIKTKAIPFLISRRSCFYKYGTMKNLERKWVEKGLVEIDPRIKKVIQIWAEKTV